MNGGDHAHRRFSRPKSEAGPRLTTYPVSYELTQDDGTGPVILRSQRQEADGACVSFELGTFDLDKTGFVRVTDAGPESVTFNRMRFTYLGPGARRR